MRGGRGDIAPSRTAKRRDLPSIARLTGYRLGAQQPLQTVCGRAGCHREDVEDAKTVVRKDWALSGGILHGAEVTRESKLILAIIVLSLDREILPTNTP